MNYLKIKLYKFHDKYADGNPRLGRFVSDAISLIRKMQGKI